MDKSLRNELAEEEEIISSSTKYLSESLNLSELNQLQKGELRSLSTLISKLYRFVTVLFTCIIRRNWAFHSYFETLVLQSEPNDCSLVAKYSEIEEFGNVSLNTINIPHPLRVRLKKSTLDPETKKEILAKIDNTPLVVFIHGLGGQSSQFEQMIAIMCQCADIFALDLPGFGNSVARPKNGLSVTKTNQALQLKMMDQFAKVDEDFWSTNQLANLLTDIINAKRLERRIVIIGHSMGTHLCIKIANRLPADTVASIILISPPKIESVLSKHKLGILVSYPLLFDIMRIWDRIGGLESKSVKRQVHGGAPFKRLKQLRWNLDVDSHVILKYIKGFTACTTDELLSAAQEIPSDRIFLICGENDVITPSKYSQEIASHLQNPNLEILDNCGHSVMLDKLETASGLVYKFLESLQDLNINLGWCLQVRALISGDKWGLKNELKWRSLTNLSLDIQNRSTGAVAPLLAMKTLRESDPEHDPVKFETKNPQVVAIIDISSDLASYNPENFKRIKYHKMPTVSKFMPDSTSIRKFISLVDEILESVSETPEARIAVHCHYGFNRTGFLICCYLIEKLGWSVDDAIAGFKTAREPGIKHPHFIDGLYVRYK